VRPEAGPTDSVPPQLRNGALTARAGFVRSEEAICCTTQPMRVLLPGGDDSNSEADMSDGDSGGGAAAPRVAAVACGSDFSLIHLATGEVFCPQWLQGPPMTPRAPNGSNGSNGSKGRLRPPGERARAVPGVGRPLHPPPPPLLSTLRAPPPPSASTRGSAAADARTRIPSLRAQLLSCGLADHCQAPPPPLVLSGHAASLTPY